MSPHREHDTNLVHSADASFYTTLVYSCGYSYSFLPNLIFCLFLLILLGLVWLFIWGRECYYQKYGEIRVSRSCLTSDQSRWRLRETWLTNFTVRLLYEIYFEICLCIMINVSHYDTAGNVAAWWLCLTIAVLAISAPIAISALLCCCGRHHSDGGGPMLPDAYEKMPLKRSIWEVKPLTQSVQEMLANFKAAAEQEEEEEKMRRERAAAVRQLDKERQGDEEDDDDDEDGDESYVDLERQNIRVGSLRSSICCGEEESGLVDDRNNHY